MQDCVWYHNIGRCFGFIFLLSAFCCSYSLCFDLEVKLSELKPGSFHKLNGEDEGVVAFAFVLPNGGLPLQANFLSFSWSRHKLHGLTPPLHLIPTILSSSPKTAEGLIALCEGATSLCLYSVG